MLVLLDERVDLLGFVGIILHGVVDGVVDGLGTTDFQACVSFSRMIVALRYVFGGECFFLSIHHKGIEVR